MTFVPYPSDRPLSKWPDLRGTRNPSAKLTVQQVLTIRARYAAGGVTVKALALEYGVASPTVSQIVSGSKWRHLLPAVPSEPTPADQSSHTAASVGRRHPNAASKERGSGPNEAAAPKGGKSQ